MQFTEYGIEAVVPPELLPPDVRSKFHARPNEKAKRARKEEEAKDATPNAEDNQVAQMITRWCTCIDGIIITCTFT